MLDILSHHCLKYETMKGVVYLRRFVAILLLLGILAACTAAALDYNDYSDWMDSYSADIKAAAVKARIPYSLSLDEQLAWHLGYAAGLAASSGSSAAPAAAAGSSSGSSSVSVVDNYVVNTNTDKFHKPTCDSVKTISLENKYVYSGSRDLLISLGFKPCKNCNP